MKGNSLVLIVIILFLGCLNNEGNKDEITLDEKALDEYLTASGIDFNGGYLQDEQLEKQYNGKKYKVEPVDTLEDLGCVVYQVESEFVNLLVLKSIDTGKYYSIYYFMGHRYAQCSDFYFLDIQENFNGFELFLNERPLDIRSCSSDIDRLLEYKGLNSDKKINSWRSLDSLLNAKNLHLNDTDEYMIKNVLDDRCFRWSRYKPEYVNVDYNRYGNIYLFCIFKDAPMVLPDGRYIVWIRSISASKNKSTNSNNED